MLDSDSIKEAISEVVEQPADGLGESLEYARRRDEGEETTLEVSTYRGSNHITVTWYVPIALLDPENEIVPDDHVEGNVDGLPVSGDSDGRVAEPPTKASELGDDVWRGVVEILSAVEELPYPTSEPDEPYVMNVFADTDTPYCSLITMFEIQ